MGALVVITSIFEVVLEHNLLSAHLYHIYPYSLSLFDFDSIPPGRGRRLFPIVDSVDSGITLTKPLLVSDFFGW